MYLTFSILIPSAFHHSDLVQIAAHFIIEQRKPIRDRENENAACFRKFVEVDGFEESLGDVHSAGRFEAVVADRVRFAEQQFQQFARRRAFFSYGECKRVFRIQRQF
jgi:hypothetical protein